MDENTVKALLNVKRAMGADFLQNTERVAALLTDFLPASPGERSYGERHVLIELHRAGVPPKLAAERLGNAELQALARFWAGALCIKESAAHQGVLAWHYAVQESAGGAPADIAAALKQAGQPVAGTPASVPTKAPTASSALETWTNSIGMAFVKIPAGSYLRGSRDDDKYADDNEKPQRRISISSFWLGISEVAQAQWEAVMGSNPSHFKGRGNPVEEVSWHDVQEFVRRLNAREGHNRYRLPTEAEWEYAARAGSTTAYCFGDDVSDLGDYAWHGGNSGGTTHPVGQQRPNAWGLYDMHGNVWEWVHDWYGEDYYLTSDTNNPRGPSAGSSRVLRGGSWDSFDCRSAARLSFSPDFRLAYFGFRLALSPEL